MRHRLISLLLTFIVILGMIPSVASAASTPEEALGEVNIYSGGYSMKYLAVNGRVQTQSYTYFLYSNSAGEVQEIPAYCVTPNQYSDDFMLKLLYEIINKKTSRRLQLPEGVFDMTTTVHGIYEDG